MVAYKLLTRKGLKSDRPTLVEGEIALDSDEVTLVVGDGTATPARIITDKSTGIFDLSSLNQLILPDTTVNFLKAEAAGEGGWSPVLAAYPFGDKVLFKIVDYQGGTGDKPDTYLDYYLSEDDIPVADPNFGADFRGKQGNPGTRGPKGDGLEIDATGVYANRDIYDNEEEGFVYLSTTGNDGLITTASLFIKEAGAGAWSVPIPIQGPVGPPISLEVGNFETVSPVDGLEVEVNQLSATDYQLTLKIPRGIGVQNITATDNENGTVTFHFQLDDSNETVIDILSPNLMGPAPDVDIGTVNTLGPADNATATITTVSPGVYALNLGIPKGNTGAAVTNITLTDNGNGTLDINFHLDDASTISRTTPDLTGPIGPAPTMTAGTTTTLDPGESATFNIVSTGLGQYRLDLSLPKGDRGETGDGDVTRPDVAVQVDEVFVSDNTAGDKLKGSGLLISDLVTSTSLTSTLTSTLSSYVLTSTLEALTLDDIEETVTNKHYSASDKEKVDFITITQPVDLDEIENRVDALSAAVVLKGTWDATTGVFPGGGTAQSGESWIVDVAGTVDGQLFNQNDKIIALVDNASTTTYAANWFRESYSDNVVSVAGKTGAVVLSTSDITSGRFIDARMPSRLDATALTITDWNTAISNGWYMGNSAANSPATGWFIGNVVNHGAAGWCTQTVHAFDSDTSSDTKTYRRELNNGTWGSWYRCRVSETELDARYAKLSGATMTGLLGLNTTTEARQTPSISSGTLTLNLAISNIFESTLNQNITNIVLQNVPNGVGVSWALFLTINGNYSISWPAAYKFPGGVAPTHGSTVNDVASFMFYTGNGGTTIRSFFAGSSR